MCFSNNNVFAVVFSALHRSAVPALDCPDEGRPSGHSGAPLRGGAERRGEGWQHQRNLHWRTFPGEV